MKPDSCISLMSKCQRDPLEYGCLLMGCGQCLCTFFFLWIYVALASMGYEKTCVLFNIGALASQIASEQNLDSDEGLKAAAKNYQVSKTIKIKLVCNSHSRSSTLFLCTQQYIRRSHRARTKSISGKGPQNPLPFIPLVSP